MAASTWWPSSARLAIAFASNGCIVTAMCPPGHPLHYVSGIKQVYEVHDLKARAALVATIQKAQPDFIIPCDDRIVAQLHELFRLHPELRPLIEYSLGDPAGFDIADSRSELHRVATELGIRVPRNAILTSGADAKHSFMQFGPVAAIKLDGTHGGEGVRIVRSAEEAAAAFRALRRSTGLLTAVHRRLIHGDALALWGWTRRARAEITIQEYIPGTPANNMVACWQGEVLRELSVASVACKGDTGSANVVRRIHQPEMVRAAQLLAARLKLSGFFGLDFILDQSSGQPYLIEMNPRCTQLGHLPFPDQGDLAGALYQRLTGRPSRTPESPIRSDLIAFYPQARMPIVPGDVGYLAFRDVPGEEKSLADYLLHDSWPERRWQARLYRKLLLRGPKWRR
jgi:hypothetical protein